MPCGAFQRPIGQKRVGIEQYYVPTASRLKAEIIRPTKAKVHRAANQQYSGKLVFDHILRSVSGSVIDNDGLDSKQASFTEYRLQTFSQHFPRIQRYDYDRYVEQVFPWSHGRHLS